MRLSLATRIFLGYAVVLVTFGAVSIYAVAELRSNQQEIRLVSQGYLTLAQDLSALITLHESREKDTRRLLDEESPDTRRGLSRLSRLYFPVVMADHLQTARENAEQMAQAAPPRERRVLEELARRLSGLTDRSREYDAAVEKAFTAANGDGDHQADLRRMRELEVSLGRDMRVVQAQVQSRVRELVESADARARHTTIVILGLSLAAIFVGLGVMAMSARTLRPIRTLTEGVSRIARGDYTAEIGLRGENEISILGREFDAMARALREREAQLREKQEALLRAEQLAAVGRISAHIAHEVRNPLSSIGLNVELLEEAVGRANFATESERKEAQEILAAMLREIDRLTDVTEQYLRLARVPRPNLNPEDVNEVLRGVLDFAREELERAGVEVVRELSPDLPRALADESQLRQVFLNLLRNGREAMAGGGRLTVRSREAEGRVEVSFSDTGHGMTPEIRERIFEPFFSTKEGGSGLGLAVSRQIVQAHGGTIDCESAPGRGTTFVIRLPRA